MGSTGATGLGTFTVSGGEPYEAQVLRFDGPCLTAVDYVSLEGVDGSFELQRRTFDMVPTAAGRCRPATTSTTTTTEAPTTEAPTAEPTPAD